MGDLFKDMLNSGQTLFKNELALDFEFLPKILPYREGQQKFIATCIKPLFNKHTGRNILMHGPPGIGKTAAVKHVFRELEETTDEIVPIYINCWQKNTTYKIFVDVCHQLGYKFTQNKRTEELQKVIENICNKYSVVFCFDEIDKVEDYDFLYTLSEKILYKSILLITNFKTWVDNLDQRILSRLAPQNIEFPHYNREETRGILKQRISYAFVEDCFSEEAFALIAEKSFSQRDIRSGLTLLREAALAAEDKSEKKVLLSHAEEAMKKLSYMNIKKSTDLEDETQKILTLCKTHSGEKIGELYKKFKALGATCSYKTFQRKIDKLKQNKFISVRKQIGGPEGTTSIISYEKKLSDF